MATQPIEAAADASASEAEVPVAENTTAAGLYPEDTQDQPDQEGGDPSEGGEGEGNTDPNVNDEAVEPEIPAIDAPVSWNGEAKEAFAKLTPDLQRVIADREADRERFMHSKAREAAEATNTARREALGHVAQLRDVQAHELQRYAAMFQPQEPDISLLQGDENSRILYFQQDALYRRATAQQQQLQQQAQQAQREAEAARGEVATQQRAQDHQVLVEKIPEWADDTSRAKLQEELKSIAVRFGYSPERLNDADATDILALVEARKDRLDAEKWRQLQKAKPATQQPKKLPPVTQPGRAPDGRFQSKPTDAASVLYPNDVPRR